MAILGGASRDYGGVAEHNWSTDIAPVIKVYLARQTPCIFVHSVMLEPHSQAYNS